jgi:hypothetical protein
MHAHVLHWGKKVTYMYFGRMTLIDDFVAFEHVWAQSHHHNTFKIG